ncbi:alpha/beta fold hydrolase [Aliagarivorans marinus]|uniref:alpha/beta fold hydrolase n=1 Tax=Aliagarivorans marinus TaxID=561965 RepID=UPI000424F190|nr:alpha/beta fold hydrolase [Aliagarivorans marinus]
MSALPFTQASALPEAYEASILPYWQQHSQQYQIEGQAGLSINYYLLSAPFPSQQLMVISPGRSEAAIKYQELAFDFAQQGYDCLIVDHRGQGFSERESDQQELGDVAKFDYYADDLNQIIQQQSKRVAYQQQVLLAHSMGGCIAARYLQLYPGHIEAAVLCAPMFGINTGVVPQPIAKVLAKTLSTLGRLFKQKPRYAPGQGAYKEKPYQDNELSRCPERYQNMYSQYQQNPLIRLGGPSSRWLAQSFETMSQAIKQADQIQIPLLVLQAELDSVVTAAEQDAFCAARGEQVVVIKQARHEILFERDELRNHALERVSQFFADPPSR